MVVNSYTKVNNTLQGKNFKDGAIISGVIETLRSLSNNLNNNKQLLTSQLIGTLSGALVDGESGAKIGSSVATSTNRSNRELHQEEIDFINSNAKIFAKEQDISESEARALLYVLANSLVDYEFSKLTDDISKIALGDGVIKFSKDDLI